jgi:hypothetical protein
MKKGRLSRIFENRYILCDVIGLLDLAMSMGAVAIKFVHYHCGRERAAIAPSESKACVSTGSEGRRLKYLAHTSSV